MLAHFAEAIRPEQRSLPDETSRQLQAYLARRRKLNEMLVVAERNRLKTTDEFIKWRVSKIIQYLESDLAEIDKEIHEQLQKSPVWREKDKLLQICQRGWYGDLDDPSG